MTVYRKVVRIFIGSPSDLIKERTLFRDTIAEVNNIKANSMGIQLEALGCEDTLPGSGRPQHLINNDLIQSDLVIMLLWKRWGTHTGKYSSGFEEEYELAKSLSENNSGKPEIWLYFRTIPDDMLGDPGEQLRQVLNFRIKIETEKKFLYKSYEDENQWQKLFREHLCRWLDGFSPCTINFFPYSLSPNVPFNLRLEKLAEYAQRIEQLEKTVGKIINKQIKTAYSLAKEAQNQADIGNLTKAEEFFAKAVSIYPETNIINSYGLFLMRIGVLKKAEDKFIQVIQINQKIGDKITQANAFDSLGNLYLIRGDFKKAKETYIKSLDINKKLGRKKGLAIVYTNLGSLYLIRKDFKAAEEMYKKSNNINKKLGRKKGIAIVYGNLGILHKARKNFKVAEEMFKKSLAISKKLGLKDGMANQYGNLGNLYLIHHKDIKTAEMMYKKSLDINQKLGRKREMAIDYGNLGILLKICKNLTAAEKLFVKSLNINKELGLIDGMAKQYFNLGNLYKTRRDFKVSKEMFNKSLSLFITMGNNTMIRKIILLIERLNIRN